MQCQPARECALRRPQRMCPHPSDTRCRAVFARLAFLKEEVDATLRLVHPAVAPAELSSSAVAPLELGELPVDVVEVFSPISRAATPGVP